MTSKPYFAERAKGGWTFQCPHEPDKAVMMVIIGGGEMVLCLECGRKTAQEFVRCAEWKE